MVINKMGGQYQARLDNPIQATLGYGAPESFGLRNFITPASQKLSQQDRDEKLTSYSWGALAHSALYGEKSLPFIEKCMVKTLIPDCVREEYLKMEATAVEQCGAIPLKFCLHHISFRALNPAPEKRPRLEDIYNALSQIQSNPNYSI